MTTYRFDPSRELTNAEITQVLRALFALVPSRELETLSPSISDYLVAVPSPDEEPT